MDRRSFLLGAMASVAAPNLPLSDGGGIHIGMPFAKDEVLTALDGGSVRRLVIECIEQDFNWSIPRLTVTGCGSISIGTTKPCCLLST